MAILIAVSTQARGLGVGSKLMEWAEEQVRKTDNITNLKLAVPRGNRAQGLYSRLGYEPIPQDCVDECCDCFFIFLLLGRPYGCCNPEWGSLTMIKRLEDDDDDHNKIEGRN